MAGQPLTGKKGPDLSHNKCGPQQWCPRWGKVSKDLNRCQLYPNCRQLDPHRRQLDPNRRQLDPN